MAFWRGARQLLAQYVVAEQWSQVVMKELDTYPENYVLDFFADDAVEACDALDGVVDNVIGDVEKCRLLFDPSTLVGAELSCGQGNITVDATTAEVVVSILQGPEWWYGLNPGAPFTFLPNTTGHGNGRVGPPFLVNDAWIKYFVKQDPSYDTAEIGPAELGQLLLWPVNRYDQLIGAADPDLAVSRDQGGKLLVWHGLSNQLIFPNGSVKYFKSVEKKLLSSAKWQDTGGSIEDFFRLFLALGIDHYADGLTVGAAPVDPCYEPGHATVAPRTPRPYAGLDGLGEAG